MSIDKINRVHIEINDYENEEEKGNETAKDDYYIPAEENIINNVYNENFNKSEDNTIIQNGDEFNALKTHILPLSD